MVNSQDIYMKKVNKKTANSIKSVLFCVIREHIN